MYRFPETTFACSNPPYMQLQHIRSEIAELVDAYDHESAPRVLEEALDAIHSLETLVRGWCHRHGLDPVVAAAEVVKKNEARGYYK